MSLKRMAASALGVAVLATVVTTTPAQARAMNMQVVASTQAGSTMAACATPGRKAGTWTVYGRMTVTKAEGQELQGGLGVVQAIGSPVTARWDSGWLRPGSSKTGSVSVPAGYGVSAGLGDRSGGGMGQTFPDPSVLVRC
jgi:hypothetical protein